MCRDGVPMDSKVVGQLKAREKVEVMRHEQVGAGKTMKNRVMLKSLTEGGLQGWVSELSGSGVRLLTTAVAVDPAKQPSATIKMYSMPVRCQWCERAKQLLAAKVLAKRPRHRFLVRVWCAQSLGFDAVPGARDGPGTSSTRSTS